MTRAMELVERSNPAQSGCSRNSLERRCYESKRIALRPPATIFEA
jgi:hypothetical protein